MRKAELFYLLVDECSRQRLDRRVMVRLREACTTIEVVEPHQRDRAMQRG